jgi:SAM-dependent methyltransferase
MLKRLRTWLKVPEAYDARDFAARQRFQADYRILATSLLARLTFDSAIDVGCANGFLLEAFVEAGKDAVGTEISAAALEVASASIRDRIRIADFAASSGARDLACCVEVAEHVRPERSEELVETLARLSRHWIFFTAAPPGQGGHGHINCRPHEEWLEWFRAHGVSRDQELTAQVRSDLDSLIVATWLRRNCFVLTRRP